MGIGMGCIVESSFASTEYGSAFVLGTFLYALA
jgi:hypothetical protein